ncbi:MAG TPA: TIGR03790 family protein [Candidatus Saccharimonadales bacterium]|nr:TIGR03790 family protein [Candidatus Saccharimonadales bacterium]
MKLIGIKLTILVLVFAPLLARANGNEVVVVYNKRMPGSKSVAEYYAKERHVPRQQIFGFSMTTNEVMSREEFRDKLQMPLAHRLESAGLWQFGFVTNAATNGELERMERQVVASKIRYVVLCYGVPLKIAPDPSLDQSPPKDMNPALDRNEAAVDSELAWLPMVETPVLLDGPMRNWVYGATNTALLTPTNGILLVARLDGPSADVAKGLVDKALEAERDGLWGRAYFDARGLPKTDNYYLGDEWMYNGAQICRELGFETTLDEKPETFPASFPMSNIAIYCGWYDADASGPFTLPKVEFMPGAFAYHLHSYSANTLRSTTQNWCGPLLAKGATCTMGCVYEPYLACTPNVAAFLARWMAAGFTFGEAAWAAQPVLSWQTTVIGDPLYQPFGKPLNVLHAELARRHSPLIQWSFLRIADLALAHGASIYSVENYLENINATTNSPVLTEKLADIYEKEGKPSSAIDMYERALQLNPSPEQCIRIRLTLGERLEQQNQDSEAYNDYQKLLQESPDYPGRTSIYQKLLALARKLNRPDDVARYEALTQ